MHGWLWVRWSTDTGWLPVGVSGFCSTDQDAGMKIVEIWKYRIRESRGFVVDRELSLHTWENVNNVCRRSQGISHL